MAALLGIRDIDLCDYPAEPAPPGEVSNLIDPPSLSSAIWGVGMVLIVWTSVFASARIFVNRKKLYTGDCKLLEQRAFAYISILFFTSVSPINL